MDRSLRHRLYEIAVQTPDRDVETIERLFRARRGRMPLSLREDFAGTALLSLRWVESDDDRDAVAVDRDRAVLEHARIGRRGLEDDAERLRLVCADARRASDRTFDVICAMNFSWALFDRHELATYLENAARSLEDDGLLILELFGGADLSRARIDEEPHEGFTYVWEQTSFDPIRSLLDARIHFRLADGTFVRNAFSYCFHLRSVATLRAAMRAAGLEPELLLEDRRGVHRRCRGEPRAPLWRGLLVGSRRSR